MSVLNKIVSYYRSTTATTGCDTANLLTLLQTKHHRVIIERLRSANKDAQKRIKATELPCYCVTGIFHPHRANDCLIQPSGLACVDLDSAENYDIPSLLRELRKIPCIAYAGLSCRGQRLFCIVLLKYHDRYQRQYERLIQSFSDAGLPMGDDCHKKISQPRFVSYNTPESEFYNHTAEPYHLLIPERTYYFTPRNYSGATVTEQNKFEIAKKFLEKKGTYFQQGNRHEYIFRLNCLLNLMGITEEEARQYVYSNLLSISEIKSNCFAPFKKYKNQFGTFNFSN